MRKLQYDPEVNRISDDENTPYVEVDPDLWMSRGDRDDLGQLIVAADGMEAFLRKLLSVEGHVSISSGVAHFPDGTSQDIKALLPRPTWLPLHQEAALREGWGVFLNVDTKALEIQRYGEADSPFASDGCARDHVSELANAGNFLAMHALDLIASSAPAKLPASHLEAFSSHAGQENETTLERIDAWFEDPDFAGILFQPYHVTGDERQPSGNSSFVPKSSRGLLTNVTVNAEGRADIQIQPLFHESTVHHSGSTNLRNTLEEIALRANDNAKYVDPESDEHSGFIRIRDDARKAIQESQAMGAQALSEDWILTVGKHGASIHSDKSGTIARIPDVVLNWKANAELLYSAPGLKKANEQLENNAWLLRQALGNLLPWIEHEDPGPGEVGDNFRADIARARNILNATSKDLNEAPSWSEVSRALDASTDEDHLTPVRLNLGPHQGLNAGWLMEAWKLYGDANGETWLLDNEFTDKSISIVTRKFHRSGDAAIVNVCSGPVATILPIAVGIKDSKCHHSVGCTDENSEEHAGLIRIRDDAMATLESTKESV